ncbi:MAG: pyridoxamine 5'-phosphate oxidase family protein [Pseudomonadota bacterium]|nr:pyridoxamine 5'-phosphate oxidase family protein [Pseudomonadota bacterium]
MNSPDTPEKTPTLPLSASSAARPVSLEEDAVHVASTRNDQLRTQWPDIKKTLEQAQASAVHCTIATVSPGGMPHITPVGTVFLRDDQTGFFFDHYAVALGDNIDCNPNVCVCAVNVGRWFWLRALVTGQFTATPGVRLYGQAGPARTATEDELRLIHDRVKGASRLKGAKQLWSDFSVVRDIQFTDFKAVTYPMMMDKVWPNRSL